MDDDTKNQEPDKEPQQFLVLTNTNKQLHIVPHWVSGFICQESLRESGSWSIQPTDPNSNKLQSSPLTQSYICWLASERRSTYKLYDFITGAEIIVIHKLNMSLSGGDIFFTWFTFKTQIWCFLLIVNYPPVQLYCSEIDHTIEKSKGGAPAHSSNPGYSLIMWLRLGLTTTPLE